MGRRGINTEKSIARAQRSTIRLADAAAEVGLSLIPGGSVVYSFGKVLVQHAVDFYRDRAEERLAEFHDRIVSDVTNEERDRILSVEFAAGDYYSVLNQVIQDEEDAKVAVYGRLFQAILLDSIPGVLKLHVVKSLLELTCSDLELMRRIYINEKYEFKAPGNKTNQMRQLTQPKDPVGLHSVQTLVRLGYLYDKDGTKPPWPTELNKILVELLYEADELTEKALQQLPQQSGCGRRRV